jgi:obscurin-RhoGEF protein
LSPETKVVFAKEQPAHSKVKAEVGDSATLSCELAQAQAEVTWYKDGKKLSSSSRVHVEASGYRRQLVVQQAGKADAGEYSCEAGGHRVSFHLDVTGQFLEIFLKFLRISISDLFSHKACPITTTTNC